MTPFTAVFHYCRFFAVLWGRLYYITMKPFKNEHSEEQTFDSWNVLLKPGSNPRNINVKNASICQDIIFYGLELEFLERSDFGVKYLDI